MSLVFPAVSLAQSAALDEIIVIAQKREQNLQDVPISVTAFSGDMVDDFGLRIPGIFSTRRPTWT